MPNATAVGQLLPVAAPNVMVTFDVAAPAEGAENVVSWRAYPLPVSSVPAVLTVGVTLYSVAYTLAGEVYVVFLNTALATALAR